LIFFSTAGFAGRCSSTTISCAGIPVTLSASTGKVHVLNTVGRA
jgi:hypothetical protein